MATTMDKIKSYLDSAGLNYQERDEETVVFPFSDDKEKILIIIRLMEDGEFLQIRTLKHLDDLVQEADEAHRQALLQWMLYRNYTRKLGVWEYDPSDHDHHISASMAIEDGDISERQFLRMLKAILDSLDDIPEMKQVLGIEPEDGDEEDEKERKRRELLEQLKALEEDGI